MKNKKELLSIAGLLATTSLAVVSGGLVNPAALNILSSVGGNVGASLAANFMAGLSPSKIKKLFVDVHPNNLNHSIKKLFVESVKNALDNIGILFAETQSSKVEKEDAKKLIKSLQKYLPEVFFKTNAPKFEEAEIKHFLYDKDKEEMVCDLIEKQFTNFEITEPFKSFLTKNIPAQIQLCFGEGLKDPANEHAWIAFQRMLIEEIRNDIKQIADTQHSIKDDLSNLKFTKSGFSKGQIEEIHQFVNLLNDKKLIEVKIKNSVDNSLQSIENKANEIIRITTNTQLTVDELKLILEKIKRQNRTHFVFIITLSGCLLIAGFFLFYKIINQPFTTTISVYGWESETQNPLEGKGTLVLILGDKIEKAEINRQGEAVFKGIMPQFNGKSVAVQLSDTENEPYFLTDSLVKIVKNGNTKMEVFLHGLAQFEGRVVEIIGENKVGVSDATVYVNNLYTITDDRGYFIIDIPKNKQKSEQYVEISKNGYITYTNHTMPMARKKTDTGCEIVLTKN